MQVKSAQTAFLFTICITLSFLLTIVIYYISLSTGNKGINLSLFGGGDDGVEYYNQALNFAKDLPYIATSIHTIVLGTILKIFNTESVILLRIFNYIGYVLLIIISVLILKKIIDLKIHFTKSVVILLSLLMIYPSLILNTSLSLYRDVWIYFFYLCSIYFFINILFNQKSFKLINLLLLLVNVYILFLYREYAAMSFVLGCILFLTITYNRNKSINFKKASVFLFVGFTLFYMFLKDFKMPFVNVAFADVLNYRQSFIELYAGGSQMNISLNESNIVMFYFNYIYSIVSNFIGPFPWQITGGSSLILMLTEGIVFIVILVVLFKNRKSFSNIDKFLIIQSFIWFMLIGISNDNIGTATRLRVVGWLPLIILFSKYCKVNSLGTNRNIDYKC